MIGEKKVNAELKCPSINQLKREKIRKNSVQFVWMIQSETGKIFLLMNVKKFKRVFL